MRAGERASEPSNECASTSKTKQICGQWCNTQNGSCKLKSFPSKAKRRKNEMHMNHMEKPKNKCSLIKN